MLSQWDEVLLCEAFSHWPSPYLGWSLPHYAFKIWSIKFSVAVSLENQHYSDVIMSVMASLITGASIIYLTVCSGADKKNIKALCYWPLWGEFTGAQWIPHAMFPFDDVIMIKGWWLCMCQWSGSLLVIKWLITWPVPSHYLKQCWLIIPPAQRSCWGVYWFHPIRPSVCPSVCPSVPHPVSALKRLRFWLDPFHIYTSYQATSEGVLDLNLLAKFHFFKICNFHFVYFFYLGSAVTH